MEAKFFRFNVKKVVFLLILNLSETAKSEAKQTIKSNIRKEKTKRAKRKKESDVMSLDMSVLQQPMLP
jgi:hypothetical protein